MGKKDRFFGGGERIDFVLADQERIYSLVGIDLAGYILGKRKDRFFWLGRKDRFLEGV